MANGLLALPVIPAEQRTPLVEALLAVIHEQQDRIRKLDETVQQLRDEIAILKSQKLRPQIARSRPW
jgi:cell division protein FtsB